VGFGCGWRLGGERRVTGFRCWKWRLGKTVRGYGSGRKTKEEKAAAAW
jgi:hypothetical protein